MIIKPNEATQATIRSVGGSELKDGIRGADLLKRTEMHYELISSLIPADIEFSDEVKEQIEIQLKYEGYIEKHCNKLRSFIKWKIKKSLKILIMTLFQV